MSDTIADRGRTVAGWLGPRLRELRTAKGLSQKTLAAQIGVTQSRIAEWESPTTAGAPPKGPVWEYVVRCALALDVSLDAFARPPADPAPPALPGGRTKGTKNTSEKIRNSD